MEAYSAWWEGLTFIQKVLWGLAVPFTIIFLFQLIFSFAGGDHADDVPDVDVETDHGIPFQFLTFKNMVGFFTIFSWTGIACLNAGFSNTITLLISTSAGLFMMLLMASIFYMLSKAVADGTMKIKQAIGQTAEVYLTVPGNRRSMGKVQVKVTGALRTLDALTDDPEDIPTGKLVTVASIVNDSILLVTVK